MNIAAAVLNITCSIVFTILITGISHGATPVDGIFVPHERDEIRNPRFKSELSAIAPNYDSLSRDEQVRAYVQTYRSLNYGAYPHIVSDEFQDTGATSSLISLPILAPVPHPRGYDTPDRGFTQKYVDGYGYKRVSVRSSSPYHSYGSEERYGRGVDRSRQIGAPHSTGTGAPPYAKPYVAGPQRIPTVRPGW